MTLRVAGIGSRKTPLAICKEMTLIGQWIRENGHICTSGHAEGADWAFEQGALMSTYVYMPWEGFGTKPYKGQPGRPILGHNIVVNATPALDAMVHRYHKDADSMSSGVFSLMRRNSCQVLGLRLNKPVDVVVCWRNAPSGTDQAIRIAVAHKIPVWNMALPQYDTASKIIAQLQLLEERKNA